MIKKKKVLLAEDMPEFQASIDNMPADSKIFVDKSLEIAHYIFQLMERKGLKQKDLAEKMGKTEAEVSKILGGMHNLTLRSIAKLEAALEDTIVYTPLSFSLFGKKIGETINEVTSKVPEKKSPKMTYDYSCKVVHLYKKHDDNNNNGNTLQEAI
ncbi:MAG: helix-turn-helix transcriptional regulator [Sphingobacteriales bacterium]|nr:helix-turn-helix transcriptional regulator [Sphingobacteriales bacterium]MBI3717382.1 helix-turn-helix transcriptional regulator [Sphingobacteriales bacterium]